MAAKISVVRMILLGVLCCGCIAQRGFPCEQRSDCVLGGEKGWCEQPVGYCSYPDEACQSKRRFEGMAGEGMAGECVPGGESGTGGELGCDWDSVYAGELHSCALDGDGAVWCWGANIEGQLGIDSTSDFEAVARQTVPPLTNIESIAAGAGHTCALGIDGDVWCWGRNDQGQVSWPLRNSEPIIRRPIRVDVEITPETLVVGSRRSCVASDRTAECWGDLSSADDEFYTVSLPGPVVSVASGETHVCLAVDDGSGGVHCQGDNDRGQLGQGDAETDAVTLYPVPLSGPAKQLAAGRWHTCAIYTRPDGQEFIDCWGSNSAGQSGSLGGGNVDVPTEVSGVVNEGPWRKVAATIGHSCALAESGEVYCWGDNSFGQSSIVFDGMWAGDSRRVVLPEISSFLAIDIAIAGPVSCALTTEREWVCWGCMTPWEVDINNPTPGQCQPTVRTIACD